MEGASATSSDTAPTSAIPVSRTRRLPRRSARLPAASGNAAKVMLKAFSIHCAAPTEEPRCAAILGRAPVTENGSIMLADPTATTVGQ
ncbi:hypothetical protein GCM10010503_40290 [Streptomyces lucensis JCM 4490]|uniref:Uncharacterized protein n=1 Tax=Streptomyces lucensis JCM 4490 TaxID=1306176 RepID=A0A918J834_9ACTN|nr:hypothetical protein GCM10010503_40290 [Streptomyces lucensis JCM 4490]